MRKADGKFLLKKLTLLTQAFRQKSLGSLGRRNVTSGAPSQRSQSRSTVPSALPSPDVSANANLLDRLTIEVGKRPVQDSAVARRARERRSVEIEKPIVQPIDLDAQRGLDRRRIGAVGDQMRPDRLPRVNSRTGLHVVGPHVNDLRGREDRRQRGPRPPIVQPLEAQRERRLPLDLALLDGNEIALDGVALSGETLHAAG